MMVQSCQQRSAEQMGLAYRDIDDGNIILRREHTVLLLSTVADGKHQIILSINIVISMSLWFYVCNTVYYVILFVEI